MTTRMTINVTNYEPVSQLFYLFQQPALFAPGLPVHSNSLGYHNLPNHDASGAVLTFDIGVQTYACVELADGRPMVGFRSGFESALRAIDLSPGQDRTTASFNPLGLTSPTRGDWVEPGAFRIETPRFQPPTRMNVGTAVEVGGRPIMSSFIEGPDCSRIDCKPVNTFFVQTGSYESGSVLNFANSSTGAAMCDFTAGVSVVNVRLNADGTWSVSAG